MTDTASKFADLFEGNQTAYGTEEGGADRSNGRNYFDRIWAHLEGDTPMGVYPLRRNGTNLECRWGCVDFDEGEDASLVYARNVAAVIKHCGGQAWVERSRSKGYHVWVFLRQWQSAQLVREALLGACQTVDAPTKEINPKSTVLSEGQLGNYVRLPYPHGLDPHRRTMVGPQGDISLDTFVRLATERLVGYDTLCALQELYQPPPKPVLPPMPTDNAARATMGPYSRRIYEGGPLEGTGRGHTLYKLACHLVEDGVPYHDAVALCAEADVRWGKFHYRTNGLSYVEKAVQKAYGI